MQTRFKSSRDRRQRVPEIEKERKKEKYERCQKFETKRKRSCLEGNNRVEKCELIRAPPTNVTHARTRGYSRCFTCSHSAELQLVLRALVHTHTHTYTSEHRSGTVAPVGHTNVHACVTSLYLFVLRTSTRT